MSKFTTPTEPFLVKTQIRQNLPPGGVVDDSKKFCIFLVNYKSRAKKKINAKRGFVSKEIAIKVLLIPFCSKTSLVTHAEYLDRAFKALPRKNQSYLNLCV